MNDIVVQKFGPIASVFANRPVDNNLSAGIQASFPILGFSGKVWQIRYRGEKHALMRPDGDGAVNSIEVVILKAAAVVSKTYYKGSFVDGSVEPPDCFSTNGIAPEPNVKDRQNPVCGTCRHNAWGSRPPMKPGDPPRKGKACADTKRLAIVMASQLLDGTGEQMGAMLLRVPPASLQEVAMYGTSMARYGYPEYSIVTRIAFDTKEVFPKLTFSAVRALTEDEGRTVLAMRDSEQTDRVLAEADELTAATVPESVPASPFEPQRETETWTMQPVGTAPAAPPASAATQPATQQPPKPQASPAAPEVPQQPIQPTVAKTTTTTGNGTGGPVSSKPAPAAEQTGLASQTKPETPSAPASAGSSQPDQPFANMGGAATSAVSPASLTNGSSSTSALANKDLHEVKQSFDEALEDQLSKLLP